MTFGGELLTHGSLISDRYVQVSTKSPEPRPEGAVKSQGDHSPQEGSEVQGQNQTLDSQLPVLESHLQYVLAS